MWSRTREREYLKSALGRHHAQYTSSAGELCVLDGFEYLDENERSWGCAGPCAGGGALSCIKRTLNGRCVWVSQKS